IYYVNDEEKAKLLIKAKQEEHPKAAHHCYAYIITQEYQNIENQSDDGEPTKTAGLPILDILRYEQLENIIAILTRYYGGIKLGTGGLVKAYQSTTKKCVDLLEVIDNVLMQGYEIRVDYSNKAILEHYFKKEKIHVEAVAYGIDVCFTGYSQFEIEKPLNELFNKQIQIKKIEKKYIGWSK
ncbi:MAG: IMPACT family protein, partial [Bacilli bacterium]